MPRRMDAAVPVDAQNAPTATWKTAENAVSHSAHTHHLYVRREGTKDDHASHTKILKLPVGAMRFDRTDDRQPLAPTIVSSSHRQS